VTGGGALWVDGRLVAPDERVVRADDHGVLVGDGVFETVLVRRGRPLLWSRHLTRLRRALSSTGIAEVPEALLERAAAEVVAAAGLSDARLRLTVTSGPGPAGLRRGGCPTLIAAALPLPPTAGPARVVTVPGARNERSPLAGVKTTSYAEAAALQALADRVAADDVVLGDSRDRVSEALTANVFVVLGDRLLTPGREAGCLPGIVREVLLEADVAEEADIDLGDLGAAREVFLTSSTSGIRPVAAIDGHAVPTVDGAATRRAREALAQAEAADLALEP
jgi:branched-chain amino acid aminotransferase